MHADILDRLLHMGFNDFTVSGGNFCNCWCINKLGV